MASTRKTILLLVLTSWLSAMESARIFSSTFKKRPCSDVKTAAEKPISYTPDMTVEEVIEENGYPVERHTVTTKDGFVLTMQRIPYGKSETKRSASRNKPVVMLQHGLLADAGCWVMKGPSKSLAHVLADAGFDVWLANSRGNRYCREFEYQNSMSWNWTFSEMAEFDLPSSINYILEKTHKEKLTYIGHSQGTLIGFAGFSLQQRELKNKVNLFIALAPIAYIGGIKSPVLRVAASLYQDHSETSGSLCTEPGNMVRCFFDLLFALFGKRVKNLDTTEYASFPSGTSERNLAHFAQLLLSGKCQKLDHGEELNIEIYGTSKPPQYQLKDIANIPIAMFSGGKDTLSVPGDVDRLYEVLGDHTVVVKFEFADWHHSDFLDGDVAGDKLYREYIIPLINFYNDID